LLIIRSPLLIGEATFRTVLSSPFFSGLLIRAETPGESKKKFTQQPMFPQTKSFQRPLKISFQLLSELKVKKFLALSGNQNWNTGVVLYIPPPVSIFSIPDK
jgi:hypothetical protein